METIITDMLPQMPIVGVLLLMFWIIRMDVNAGIERMESRLDRLLEHLLENDQPKQ